MRGQVITVQGKSLMAPTVSVQIGVENTVPELKQQIAAALQENVDIFRLVYNKQTLKLTDQLCHYGIGDNATVYIMMKMGHVCDSVCQTPGTRYFHEPPYHADQEK
jgi:hypothetical protein